MLIRQPAQNEHFGLVAEALILVKFSLLRGDGSNTDMTFDILSGGVLTEVLRIDDTGNIGIGTTSPSSKLTVAGNTYVGGNLTATGAVILSALRARLMMVF